MKMTLMIADLIMALLLFCTGRYFYKSKDTDRSIMFLSGDYTGLDSKKICRTAGKRFMIMAVPFLAGTVIDFFKAPEGTIVAYTVFAIIFAYHLLDMIINRNKKYRRP